MKEQIEQYLAEIAAFNSNVLQEIEQLRIRFLGKKGILGELFEAFKTVPGPDKKEAGILLNTLKNAVQEKINELRTSSEESVVEQNTTELDLTRPVGFYETGSRHPVAIVRNRMVAIFRNMGFSVAEGPEIEDDWHNFSALNFPPDHPARDMQDTFFIEKRSSGNDISLRTHTSSVQVRTMEQTRPPIRMVFPGRVFRNEAISARSHCIFHQVEGLYINKNVSFADLKQTLLHFAREMFGEQTQIRLRPSYFPFTEPSAEMDISCNLCGGKGCNICKYTGWIEILGCGMIDPAVLESCGIDPEMYTGYAFGIGIERMTMGLFQVKDIRMFFENDMRFLKQFESVV